ncbi:hypothetical protein D3C85_1698820 [compost metagenome]
MASKLVLLKKKSVIIGIKMREIKNHWPVLMMSWSQVSPSKIIILMVTKIFPSTTLSEW